MLAVGRVTALMLHRRLRADLGRGAALHRGGGVLLVREVTVRWRTARRRGGCVDRPHSCSSLSLIALARVGLPARNECGDSVSPSPVVTGVPTAPAPNLPCRRWLPICDAEVLIDRLSRARAHNGEMDTERQRPKGRLRVYLGTGPAAGKTYAMVQEGHRLATRRDTVVAASDLTGPSSIVQIMAGLELVGAQNGQVDVTAMLRRRPQVALVDRLGHPQRQMAVACLLEAGIDVLTTVDVTEIQSLRDTVEAITDVTPPASVPDALLDQADDIHLVDATPDEIRRRVAIGDLGPAVPAWATDSQALGALRHVALLWLAERLAPDRIAIRSLPSVSSPGAQLAERGVGAQQVTTSRPSGWRLRAGWLLALAGPPTLTYVLLTPSAHLDLQLIVQLFLALVVLVALVGGLWPAVVTAGVSSASLNWYFTPPRRTWIIHDPQDVAAIAVFVLVAVAVASVVHRNVQRTGQALRAEREAAHYGELATSLLASPAQLDMLLTRALHTFKARRAAVIREEDNDAVSTLASTGASPSEDDDRTISRERIDDRHVLLVEGADLTPAEQRLLVAYAASASAILTRLALQASASTARALERDNVARTALLSAVSHDLRTPLATIKAASSGLLDPSVRFADEDRWDLLQEIDASSDELDALISDLLDVSRLHQGALAIQLTTFELQEALPAAGWPTRVNVSPTLRHVLVFADRGLLERVIANLVDNSLAHAGATAMVELSAISLDGRVRLLVRDDGQGIASQDRTGVFMPFQRRGDAHSGHIGLGLAIARGLVEAMGGSITPAETPGGGLTMVIDLPAGVPSPDAARAS